jgi:endoglycosylceramidase
MSYVYDPGSARALEKSGLWFKDADGRFCTFHGVNLAGRSKAAPYLPYVPTDAESVAPQLDLLRELGFNVVRVLVIWKALEQQVLEHPETLSPQAVQYLQELLAVIDALHARGLFVFLDFHQDIAHEIYGGDGFPDWALAVDSAHPLPAPADFRDRQWVLNYAVPIGDRAVSCRHTLASFWRNNRMNDTLDAWELSHGADPQDHYVKTIGAVAAWFQALNGGSGHPAIIGYELFNEPHETELDPSDFEEHVLPNLYANATSAIRQTDKRSFVFVEPRVAWNDRNLTPTTQLDTTALAKERTVFAYHHYDSWTISYGWAGQPDSMANKQSEWPGLYNWMHAAAEDRGLIPFMTELGASQDWQTLHTDVRPDVYHGSEARAYMDIQLQQTDTQVMNWTYWNYNLYNAADDGWNLENFSLLGANRQPRNIDVVARPYAHRTSAQPVTSWFDLGSKHFALLLKGPVVDAPTVVYVPRRMHYPGDFEVRATTKVPLQWDDTRQLLIWQPDKTLDRNQIVICPVGQFQGGLVPSQFQDVLRSTVQAVRMPSPWGSLDQAVPTGNGAHVAGWAIDAETTGAVQVQVAVDGVVKATVVANMARPDIAAAYPAYGANHGFAADVSALGGARTVTVTAVNTGAGRNTVLGTSSVFVPIPTACQPIQNQIEQLQAEIVELQEGIPGGLKGIGGTPQAPLRLLQSKLAAAQAQLTQCLQQHS